jgi:hypothetical protein
MKVVENFDYPSGDEACGSYSRLVSPLVSFLFQELHAKIHSTTFVWGGGNQDIIERDFGIV